jgi:GGDEF domain-containing protein
MTRLRKSLVFLVIHLAIVFNLERLDLSGENVVNIQSFVYGLILLSVVSAIVIPLFQNHSVFFMLVVWISTYLVLKGVVFNAHALFGGIYTYLTITEMTLLTITIFLAKDLIRNLGDFESIIEKVTLPKYGERIVPLKAADEEIKTEFIRSRRHNRPLSVMVVDIDLANQKANLERIVKDVQQVMVQRFVIASMAQLITKEARRTDMILEQDPNGAFILLCPETNTEGSAILADRIQAMAQERLGVNVSIGYSSFPDEALNFEELLQKAEFNVLNPKNMPVYELP